MSDSVPIVEGALAGFAPGSTCSSDSDLRAVMRVFTTQIGFVIKTVALPAIAHAIIDSTVVSFFEARPAFRAAFSKKALVHSYPILLISVPLTVHTYRSTHSNSIRSS